jgi:hypothetical protein
VFAILAQKKSELAVTPLTPYATLIRVKKMAAYAALCIVIREHAGYLKSFRADRQSRLVRCKALLDECEIQARAISEASPLGHDPDNMLNMLQLMDQIHPLWDVMTIRILHFAPELTPDTGRLCRRRRDGLWKCWDGLVVTPYSG